VTFPTPIHPWRNKHVPSWSKKNMTYLHEHTSLRVRGDGTELIVVDSKPN